MCYAFECPQTCSHSLIRPRLRPHAHTYLLSRPHAQCIFTFSRAIHLNIDTKPFHVNALCPAHLEMLPLWSNRRHCTVCPAALESLKQPCGDGNMTAIPFGDDVDTLAQVMGVICGSRAPTMSIHALQVYFRFYAISSTPNGVCFQSN